MSHYPKLWKSGIWVFCSNPHCLAQSQAHTDDFGIELDSSKHLPGPQPGLLLTLDVTIYQNLVSCWPPDQPPCLMHLSGLACDCPNTCTESANSILRYEFLWSWALWHSSISATPGRTFWSEFCTLTPCALATGRPSLELWLCHKLLPSFVSAHWRSAVFLSLVSLISMYHYYAIF